MAFFGDEGGAGDGGEVERIEAGGIPLSADARLKELAGPGALFTSTLGVSEFALLSELECVPLGQVLGASVHRVGWQYLEADAQWGGEVFCELESVGGAWDGARRRAFDRLIQEATLLGADAVVGVRLNRGEHDWARATVDYVVSGTGIRQPESERTGRPVLTDLSGQEYWELMRSGWAPAALVAATSVFFVAQSSSTRWRRRASAARNQELNEFSRGFSAAREMVVRYLRRQADEAGATGIVGVRLQHLVTRRTVKVATYPGQQRTGLSVTTLGMGGDVPREGRAKRDGLAITIHAVGTAIRRQPSGSSLIPTITVSLGGRA